MHATHFSNPDATAGQIAGLIDTMVGMPFFTVAEIVPKVTGQIARPLDAAFLLRVLADRLDPARAGMPVVPRVELDRPFVAGGFSNGFVAEDSAGQVIR